jgi:hypothetical protein
MPHVNFDPNTVDWKAFFGNPPSQVGGAYFRGVPYMRGNGIGSVFKSLYRFLLPFASTIGREVGREGLSVGARVLGDIAKGDAPKEAITVHTREGLHNLMSKAANKLQKGSGRRRKKKTPRRQTGRGKVVHTYSSAVKPKGRRRKRPLHSMSGDSGERSFGAFSPPPAKKKRSKKRHTRVDSLGLY